MTLKRTMCALLAASMLTTGVVAVQSSASAATVENESGAEVTTEAVGLADSIENGNILHCFNWKLSDIKAELPNIAKAGYTSVQTSPMQSHNSTGAWYWLYQPLGFSIGNELGSYDELKSLCAEADKYGIKVIVDVVANHLAGWKDGKWANDLESSMRKSEYFHNEGACSNWDNRYDVTHKNIGMPDLNSENTGLQGVVAGMVDSLKSAGVDGIRWDAAKHIGLPSESCNFWPAVTKAGLYNYGEILDNPAGSSGDDYNSSLMAEYGKYIGVTDATYSGTVTGAIRDGGVPSTYGNWTARGVAANRVVYWAESHDTYCNNGWTNGLSTYIMNKAYAVVGSRNGSQALYLSRPFEKNHDSIMYGVKGDTSQAFSKEVTAVNNFRNAMGTSLDYYQSSNGCAVITRKGGGAVIVKGSGDGYVEVTNGGGYAKSGTYKDAISGNTFEVTSSTIKGQIGSTGIAVIYEGSPDTDSDTDTGISTDTSSPVVKSGVNIYFDNSSFNWSSVYAYVYDDSTSTTRQMSAWPGVKMTNKNSDGYFTLNVDDFANGKVIFTEGESSSNRYPADMQPGLEIGGSSKLFKSGNAWVAYTEKTTTDSDKSTDSSTVKPVTGTNVYFDNTAYNWSSVYAYVYDDSTSTTRQLAAWPGTKMTNKNSEGYLVLNVDDYANGKVIFTEGESSSNRYPADMQPGLEIGGQSHLFKAGNQWVVYTEKVSTDTSTDKNTDTNTDKSTDTSTDKGSEKITVLCGDANQDGTVSLRDASLILKASVGKATFSGNGKTAADVDNDSSITTADSLAVQRYDIGISSNSIGSKVEKNKVA